MTRPLSLSALARNRSGAFRMVALLASGALLGKILGFARELLMARVFGASLVADSFRGAGTAVMIPLIPMQNEGVPAVMIPMHRAWQEQGKAPEYFAALCAGLTAIAVLIALAIEASGSWWVALIMGRMEPEGQAIALTFVRVMAVWMPASVLLNCLSAAEIATGRSRIAALRPTVLNASVMTGIVLYAVTGKLIFLPVLFALSFNVLGIWGVWTLWREGALDPKGLRACLIRPGAAGVLRAFTAADGAAAGGAGAGMAGADRGLRVRRGYDCLHRLCANLDRQRGAADRPAHRHGGLVQWDFRQPARGGLSPSPAHCSP